MAGGELATFVEEIMIGNIVQLIAGGLLLVAGKRLYWFFVGLCGATAGLFISEFFLHPEGMTERIIVAVAIGAGFAVLALILQKIMVGVAGFIAGGFLFVSLLDTLKITLPDWNWAVFLIGGLIGIFLVKILFDLALVIISSFAGATLIIRGLNLGGSNGLIILLVLILAGIVFQSAQNRSKPTIITPESRP